VQDQVAELITRFSEQQIATFMLVIARVAPLFLLAPMFSSKAVPARAKTIIALALALGMMPAAMSSLGNATVDMDVMPFAFLIVKEMVVGLAFSFALSVLQASIQAAGSLLDSLIGFSFGASVDPINGNQSTVMAQLYSMFAVVIFIAIDGDAWMIQGLARTYALVPVLGTPDIGSMVAGVQLAFSGIFAAAVEIAAPVMLAVILTDVAFGVVSKVVPQMNVYAVGFPAKMIVGILMIGVSLPFVAGWIHDELQQSVYMALRTLKVA
jgi:flagellar biosynthetic protein FliR